MKALAAEARESIADLGMMIPMTPQGRGGLSDHVRCGGQVIRTSRWTWRRICPSGGSSLGRPVSCCSRAWWSKGGRRRKGFGPGISISFWINSMDFH